MKKNPINKCLVVLGLAVAVIVAAVSTILIIDIPNSNDDNCVTFPKTIQNDETVQCASDYIGLSFEEAQKKARQYRLWAADARTEPVADMYFYLQKENGEMIVVDVSFNPRLEK